MRCIIIFTTLLALLALAFAPIFQSRAFAADEKPLSQPEEIVMKTTPQRPAASAASPDSFQLDRFSINAAGAIDDSSASYRLGLSLGEPVVGTASSASYQTSMGFWGRPCSFIPGDANGDSIIDISDAVHLIAYIFAGGPAPNPLAAGDASCDGSVDISDAVYLIAYIFGGGPPPCDGCE